MSLMLSKNAKKRAKSILKFEINISIYYFKAYSLRKFSFVYLQKPLQS